jgi:hypothetical protein
MSVPDNVREDLRQKLWKEAEQIGWFNLSSTVKSKHYETWTRDPNIGGILSRYIGISDVRVYLKDSLLKDFSQRRFADDTMPYRVLGIPLKTESLKNYVKPHGRRLCDGRIICWGRASAWKALLMTAHERSHREKGSKIFGVILTHATGRYKEPTVRSMIEQAANKIGVEKLIWSEF